MCGVRACRAFIRNNKFVIIFIIAFLTFITFGSKLWNRPLLVKTPFNQNPIFIKQEDFEPSKIAESDKAFLHKNIGKRKSLKEPAQVLKIAIDDNQVNESEPTRIYFGMGTLDVHVWHFVCSFTINSMRQFPLFPRRPQRREKLTLTHELTSKLKGQWLAQRIMGYIHPPMTGSYQFQLSSFFLSELWLSTDQDPKKAELISEITRNKIYSFFFSVGNNRPRSKPVYLNKDVVYYFEILHVINDAKSKEDHVRLLWKMPNFEGFTSISSAHVSSFLNANHSENDTNHLIELSRSLNTVSEDYLKNETEHGINMEVFGTILANHSSKSQHYNRENAQSLEYMDKRDVKFAFPECTYSPSYTRKRRYKRYEGVKSTHFTDVFPNDETTLVLAGYQDPTERYGNDIINDTEVYKVVKMFKERLPGKYVLEDIINVERNVDPKRGNRYFLELAFRDTKNNRVYRTAEYVFRFKNKLNRLCKPRGVEWRADVTVTVILTVKNQGDWAVNFIEDVAWIQRATKDLNLNFVVVDYSGDDVDMKQEFIKNGIENFTVVRAKGAFHKTLAINKAVEQIKDPNSIIFLMDLHLRLPTNIFDIIRKHTIQGLMSFTPVVFRLQFCGRPGTWNTHGSGWWERAGYGLFSIYKSDWDNFGGMNVRQFTNKWGGEDWEMVDRVLAKGIEIERLCVPEMYHFFHNKDRMWERSGSR